MADTARVSQWAIETATATTAPLRTSQYVIEYATPTYVATRISQWVIETLLSPPNPLRVSQYLIEYITAFNAPVVGAPGCALGVPSAVTGDAGCPAAAGDLA